MNSRKSKTTNSKTKVKSAPRKTSNLVKKSVSPSNKRSASVNSIENGIEILEYAIKKNLSASGSAREKGFGRNYISDIRARLMENYSSKNITRIQYSTFSSLYKQYEKANKK